MGSHTGMWTCPRAGWQSPHEAGTDSKLGRGQPYLLVCPQQSTPPQQRAHTAHRGIILQHIALVTRGKVLLGPIGCLQHTVTSLRLENVTDLSNIWRSFLYSSVYSCHLFLTCSVFVRSKPFLSLIVPIFTWNVPLVSLIFLKRSLVFQWCLLCPKYISESYHVPPFPLQNGGQNI